MEIQGTQILQATYQFVLSDQREWALTMLSFHEPHMSQVSNPALDLANHQCSPLVAHNLLFLELPDTGKSPVSDHLQYVVCLNFSA